MKQFIIPLLLLLASASWADVVFVSSKSVSCSASDWTTTFSCSGTDSVLLVASGSVGYDATASTFNGDSMVLIASNTYAYDKIGVYYLKNPDAGEHIISITHSGDDFSFISATCFSGVDQDTIISWLTHVEHPTDTFNPGYQSIVVPSSVGSIVVDYFRGEYIGDTETPGSGQIYLARNENMLLYSSYKPGETSTTMEWYSDAPDFAVHIGFSLNPAGASPSVSVGDVVGQGESDSGAAVN